MHPLHLMYHVAMTGSYNQGDINLTPSSPTIHFGIGNVGAPALAPIPGTPDAAAMAVFGQLNITSKIRIEVIHYHQIEDGSGGSSVIEVYRRRNNIFTLLTTLTLAFGGGNFSTAFSTPIGDLAILDAGDYLFCQATAFQVNGDGVTIDIHFNAESIQI